MENIIKICDKKKLEIVNTLKIEALFVIMYKKKLTYKTQMGFLIAEYYKNDLLYSMSHTSKDNNQIEEVANLFVKYTPMSNKKLTIRILGLFLSDDFGTKARKVALKNGENIITQHIEGNNYLFDLNEANKQLKIKEFNKAKINIYLLDEYDKRIFEESLILDDY